VVGTASPRPDEPDIHLRFTTASRDFVIDVIACATAASNVLQHWQDRPATELEVRVVRGARCDCPRLAAERLWL